MFRKALFALLAALVALAAAEGALRAATTAEALLFEWERPSGLIALSDGGEVVARPGMEQTREDGPYRWRTHLEALGFREDNDVTRAKPVGTTRILALGDSWMFGYSVDQGATIPDVLERLLPAALGRPVELINAGVFGASAFDMLVRYRQLVDAYHPDAVLLGQPHNAVHYAATGAQRTSWYRGIRDGPASNIRIYLLIRRGLAPFRGSIYAEPPTGAGREPEFADLLLLAEDARARGLPVYFIEMPNHMSEGLSGHFKEGEFRRGLASGSAEVLFGGHAMNQRSCWGFRDEGHPSAAGAFAIATAMVPVIATGASQPITKVPTCDENTAVGPGKSGL